MPRRGVMTEGDLRRLGIKVPSAKPAGRRLPSLVGPPGLSLITEHRLQTQIVAHFRRVLRQPAKVRAIPNQRTVAHLSDEQQRKILRALYAEGLDPESLDLEFIWDPRLGAPGSRGVAWIEVKRPVNPEPVSVGQDRFIADARAMGFVAGVAQSLEQAEALLSEAGAPLLIRILGKVPPPEMAEAPMGGNHRRLGYSGNKRP
jgi:hypothetical protein